MHKIDHTSSSQKTPPISPSPVSYGCTLWGICKKLTMVYQASTASRALINIKISSYHYRKSYCGDKTVVRTWYLHNWISNTGKMTSLYWISHQGTFLVTIRSPVTCNKYITVMQSLRDGCMWADSIPRNHSVYAPSQWAMVLQCNTISHWWGSYTEWSLHTC